MISSHSNPACCQPFGPRVPLSPFGFLGSAIARVFGAEVFTARDLTVCAGLPEGAELRGAILGVVGTSLNTKGLGWRLRSIEGQVFDGLSINRVEPKENTHRTFWAVKPVSPV